MADFVSPSTPRSLAFQAAVRLARDHQPHTLQHALLMDVILWERSAQPLDVEDYPALYEARGADFYLEALLRTVVFYQQLHAVVAGIVVVAASCAEPPIPKVENLQKLGDKLGEHPDAELRARFEGVQREVGYLKWLCSVRNKAVQHRAGNEHYSSDGILLRDGLAFVRQRQPMDERLVVLARLTLQRVNRRYGLTLDTAGSSEIFAYLDLVSQTLYGVDDDEFDQLRRLIEDARLYQVIMSPSLIETTDRALAALISIVPADRTQRPASADD